MALEYAAILSIMATVVAICVTLLCRVLEARTAGSWISERATRLREQFEAAFEEEATDDEPWWAVLIFGTMLVTGLGTVLGVPYSTTVWALIPLFCVLLACGVFLWSLRPWRVSTYEKTSDPMTWPTRVSGSESRRSNDEILTEANVEEMEDRDQMLTDEDYMDNTDDTWSSNLDTPSASETESSHSNDTSDSTNNVRTGRAAIQDTSVREATRAGYETAASYLDSFILPPAVQDPQKKPSNLPNFSTTKLPTTEPFQTSEQTPFGKHMSTRPGHKWVYPHQPTLTSYVAEKAEHQPLDMIVLQVMLGTDYQEKILVRMYKTTPFVQLKDKLRKKDEHDTGLVVKGPRGDFPVFDYETPFSVSSVHCVY
jgi:hypothetical protein